MNHQEEANSETFFMGSDAAEFLNRVQDQVRSRQKKNVESCRFRRRAFNNFGNVHGCNNECGDIHGKEFSTIQNFIMNSRDLTLKQMFDITAKLVGEQEEINNLDYTHWRKNSWRELSLIGDETVISFQRGKVCLLGFFVVLREDPSTS